jgi:diguanylate cyclase (GGDEF)-like protein/PAS domain S-box-containing protein
MKVLTISLRWQIILLATLILSLMTWAFSWQQQDWVANKFSDERVFARARHIEIINQLLADESAHLQNLSGMLASLDPIRQGLVESMPQKLIDTFDPLWSDLNLGLDLEAARYYDGAGKLVSAWGQDANITTLQQLVLKAGQDESPQTLLSCEQACLFYTIVPQVHKGRFIGAIVLGTGLQDMILRFRSLSKADLAVLTSVPGDRRPRVAILDAYLVSVSGDPRHRDLLRALKGPPQYGEYTYRLDGREYRIHPFVSPVHGASVRFAAIEDVSEAVDAIKAANRQNIVWGSTVLVAAIALLYALFMPLMRRFQRMTLALPLLGQGRYDEMRRLLPLRSRVLKDEVDELCLAASDLANTLERLNAMAAEHARKLADQAMALRQERDFITSLLDTAPALIVTHTADGRIQLANAHAIQASGRDTSELYRLGFIEGFFSPDQHASLRVLLEGLEPGEIRHSEGHFSRPDGIEREVVWFHSRYSSSAETNQTRLLSVGLDVTAHKQAERRLSMLVDHDAVTGLLSRSAFQRELDLLLRSAQGRGVLFVCDIDEFRAVNEASGHERGDALLALFARKATTHEPLPTLAARLAGDEFAFYYTDMSVAEAIVVARGLNQSLVGIGPALGLPKHSFTSCVGIAFSQDASQHADGLIANAEAALAQARQKGEGNWHLYSPHDAYQADKGRRVYWSDELGRALAEERLALHFQPILDLKTRHVGHWEALIRLHASDGSLVMPGQFMGVAEATGLVRRLDRWVIAEATRTVRHALQAPGVRLALNLSGRSLDDEETLETLRHCLWQEGISGDRFILEITETAALADIKSAARLMARYRELGCAFSLDDFGVGYTSFQYLKELPVDSVKIDGSFIVGLKRNRDDQVFVKALTEAVHGFGKQVVAEFVEDGETLDLLQEYGVDYAQGYFIGRPSSKLALPLAA